MARPSNTEGKDCGSCFWRHEATCLHRLAFGDAKHDLKKLRGAGGMCGPTGKKHITEDQALFGPGTNAFEVETPPCGDNAFMVPTDPINDNAFLV